LNLISRKLAHPLFYMIYIFDNNKYEGRIEVVKLKQWINLCEILPGKAKFFKGLSPITQPLQAIIYLADCSICVTSSSKLLGMYPFFLLTKYLK